MKKFLLSLGVALGMMFTATPVQAGIFSWGIEGGLNMSKMHLSNDFVKADNRAGWFAGLKAKVSIPLAGLGLDGALLYSQKYMNVSYMSEDVNEVPTEIEKEKTLPYLEIPVNLRYNIGLSSLVGVYVATGPQWNYYLGGKSFHVGPADDAIFGRFKESTFSWNIGAGINAFSHLQVGVSYNIAMGKTGNVWSEDGFNLDTFQNIKMRNNTWQVRLAYWF